MSIENIAAQPIAAITGATERVAPDSLPTGARAKQPTQQNVAELAAPKIEQIAQRLESYIRSVSRSLEFKVDAASGRTVISVLDAETGDLIRQIPNEEVLRFAELAEEQTIVLLNETV